MEHIFKVGDKVEFTEPHSTAPIGYTGIVTKIEDTHSYNGIYWLYVEGIPYLMNDKYPEKYGIKLVK